MNISDYITDIPDYPSKGVIFKDITPLLADYQAFSYAVNALAEQFCDQNITRVVGAEARGFIVGTALALKLKAGFVPARKPGKLPGKTIAASYQLEYGTDSLEMHENALQAQDRVLIVDDVLATGGTAAAQWELCAQSGAEIVGMAFLLELDFLHGRKQLDKIGDMKIFSLIHVE